MVLGPAEWRDRATAMFAGVLDDANREVPLRRPPVASGQQPASDSDAGTASEPIGAEVNLPNHQTSPDDCARSGHSTDKDAA